MRSRARGFTLLEILVALAVTAVLLAALARAVPTALAARSAAAGQMERATTSAAVVASIERELASMVDEPVVVAASPARLEFTGGAEPGERIAYALERGALVRRAAPRGALDGPGGAGTTLLRDVAAIELAAFDGSAWTPTWTLPDAPGAVRLRVVFGDGQTIETVVPIPISRRRGGA
jgi:prepilin-type N-terminal cleavage/methylation domain-containing protein